MVPGPNAQDRLNSFALVSYIPDPLGRFLDALRREFVPGFNPHAHVTILPPRPISAEPDSAVANLAEKLSEFPAFEIEIAQVEIFRVSEVIYLGIGRGEADLLNLHQALNIGPVKFEEPFKYHPHITLAQDLSSEQATEILAGARRQWASFPHRKAFPVETLTFVQNTVENTWVDLAQFTLKALTPVRKRR